MKHSRLWTIAFVVVLTAFTAYTAFDTFLIPRVYQVVDVAESDNTSADDSAGTGTAGSTAADETDTTETTESESQAESSQGIVVTAKSSESAAASADSSSDTETESSTEESSTDTATVSASSAVSSSLSDATVISTDSYSSDGIAITVTIYEWNSTRIYVADISVSSAEYLKTAFAQNSYGKNVTATTSSIAAQANAVLAINGDYYGSQESGYVIRNGVLYRDTADNNQEDLVIYSDGSFSIINESEVTAQELLDDGAEQVLSFGPALVEDGQISVTEGEEVGKAKASNPRTAIGIVDDLHYVMLVADGRTSESTGLSLYELAEFMQSLGVETAYNLDGGGSSTMYFNGEVINKPTTDGRSIKERKVSDIVYIG